MSWRTHRPARKRFQNQLTSRSRRKTTAKIDIILTSLRLMKRMETRWKEEAKSLQNLRRESHNWVTHAATRTARNYNWWMVVETHPRRKNPGCSRNTTTRGRSENPSLVVQWKDDSRFLKTAKSSRHAVHYTVLSVHHYSSYTPMMYLCKCSLAQILCRKDSYLYGDDNLHFSPQD